MQLRRRRRSTGDEDRDGDDDDTESNEPSREHSAVTSLPHAPSVSTEPSVYDSLNNRRHGGTIPEGPSDALADLIEETDAQRKQTRVLAVYERVMSCILTCLALYTLYAGVTTFQQLSIILCAVTMWLFPAYYCQVIQEYLNNPVNEDRTCVWSRTGFYIHRILGQTSRDFYGRTHGEPTDMSRGLSCFSASAFVALALYLITTVTVGDRRDHMILYKVIGEHAVMWLGVTTMHKMIPRPEGAVFRLDRRALAGVHAMNFVRVVTPLGVSAVVFCIWGNLDAMKRFDGYAIAFSAIFCVDVYYYTLRLFRSDDPMMLLTSTPGIVWVEVLNLHYLMMAMLAKASFLRATLEMSDRAKKVWILTELVVQVASLLVLRKVAKRYIHSIDDRPLRHHAGNVAAKMITVCSLSLSVAITWGGYRPTG